jgi:NAD(P)-dependent dehydrogenase (short-subunit alcohol dehydrogenase family)
MGVVIITGGSGLIGAELTQGLVRDGHQVFNLDLNPVSIKGVSNMQCNLKSIDEIKACLNKIYGHISHIDLLINNAGIDAKVDDNTYLTRSSERFSLNLELLEDMYLVNMKAMIFLTCEVLNRNLTNRLTRIINVASVYSYVSPTPQLYKGLESMTRKSVEYVATKSFIPNFTRYVTSHFGEDLVVCNNVVPHGIVSEPTRAFKDNWAALTPNKVLSSPFEVWEAVKFLSHAPISVNGIDLKLDGGWTSR